METQVRDAPAATEERAVEARILVVDDNIGLAEILGYTLEDAGYEAVIAGTGAEALAAARSEAFDVAVLDLQLPDTSGLDLFGSLRAADPNLEGIIVTGHASLDSAVDAVNAGMFGYLVKPIHADAVMALVERALERKRLQLQVGALQDVLDAALESVGLSDVYRRTLQVVRRAMDADAATLLLTAADGDLTIEAADPDESEAHARFRLRPGEGFSGRILVEGEPRQVPDIHENGLVVSPYVRAMGLRSLLGVPVVSGGSAIGVLQVGTRHPRHFTEGDIRLLAAIAQRVALATEKARLLEERDRHLRELDVAYRREHRIADTLQRSMLPDLRVDIRGLRLAYLYQAAMEEAEVGGDFYDVVELSDGLVAVVMGDVSGKGLDAAMFTALTKYTLRGYALENPDPARVLERLNRAFYQQSSEETFATLIYAVMDLEPGRIAYASAGHEPALLHRPQTGVTDRLGPTGIIAGILPDADYHTEYVEFSDHDWLFLYTDGASDARRDGKLLGTDGLQRLLEEAADTEPQDALAAVYEGILNYSRRELRDDTALLLMRRRPEELSRTP